MTQALEPTFRELEQREAQDLIARNHVGRIAYSFRDRVDIEPISYVYADGAIYMRTELGSKLATLARAPWVAFEVDEVEGPFDWRSIVAHGTVYVLHEAGTPTEQATYRLALQRLRQIMPSALHDDDPVPGRRILLRLQPATITGRAASSGTTDPRVVHP